VTGRNIDRLNSTNHNEAFNLIADGDTPIL